MVGGRGVLGGAPDEPRRPQAMVEAAMMAVVRIAAMVFAWGKVTAMFGSFGAVLEWAWWKGSEGVEAWSEIVC